MKNIHSYILMIQPLMAARIFYGQALYWIQASTARNAVFYGDKAIDRSPCGTGTSARMAQWYAKGKLKEGDTFIHESIIGSKFTGKVERFTTVGDKPAIIPSVEGMGDYV
jgi:proline racemase